MRPHIDRGRILRWLARVWIAFGTCIIVGASLSAVAAFGLDIPVDYADPARMATTSEAAWALLSRTAVGIIYVATGFLIARGR